MELAELMQSFQESMKVAKKDSEAREARARMGPKAAPKPAPKRGRPKVLAPSDPADREPLTTPRSDPVTRKRDSSHREHSTPKKGKPKGDRSPSTPRENLRSSPPQRRMRLRRAIVDSEKTRIGEGSEGHENHEVTGTKEATEGKDGKVKDVKVVKLLKDTDLSNLDLSNRELLKLNRKRPAEDTVPTKRSARLASSETSSQVSMHTPRPFDAGKHKGREDSEKSEKEKTSQTSETSHQNESEVDAANAANAAGEGREEPTTSAAATAVSGEGEEERQQPHQEVVKSVKSSVAKEKLAPPDTADDWRKLASLMKQLPKRCNNFVHEESEVASFLEAAAQCVGSFVEDLQISYIRLTAANSLLDLAAALICDESGELAPIMTTSIATRCVLNIVAQQMASSTSNESNTVDLLNLEPVPTAEHLTKFCAHLDDLFTKSSLRKLDSFDVMQKCCSLARRDDKDPRNLEVAICRPAACAVLALSKTLAMEAADAEAENLVLLEARARVRAASKTAAERVADELSQEFEAQQQRCARAAVAAAADEAQKEVKELQKLNAEICQGRHVLESWAAMLKAQAVPVDIWGRPVDVSAADWVRMNDGQHLNDSLIDFFVSMLVGLLGGSRLHAFSSHFYARLAGPEDGADQASTDQGWQRVRTWTRAVRRRHVTGIFACDYLLVPLHHEEEHHWSLAVVCRPWAAIDQLDNWASASTTTVAFLDSLYSTSSESRQETVVQKLCQYLECEWRVCGAVGTFQASRVQAVVVDVPQQTNNFDCGIYVLEFVLQLLQHPWRLAALGQHKVTFQVCADAPRRRWHDAAMKLREMKEAAPAAGVESAWFAARLWLQELQKAELDLRTEN